MPDHSTPARETFGNHCATVLEVYVRCEALRRNCSSFVVAYSKQPHEPSWHWEAKTEAIDKNKYPNYRQWSTGAVGALHSDSIKIAYSLESLRQLRIEVYKVKDIMQLNSLEAQAFIGFVEVSLPHVHFKQGHAEKDGWVIKDIVSPMHEPGKSGRVALMCREDFVSKQFVAFTATGENVQPADFWKFRPDPYMTFYRTDEYKKTTLSARQGRVIDMKAEAMVVPVRTPVFRSDVARKTRRPTWLEINLTVPTLCLSQENALIEVELRDWSRLNAHDLIGHCCFCLEDLQKAFRDNKPLRVHLGRPHKHTCPRRKSAETRTFERIFSGGDVENQGAESNAKRGSSFAPISSMEADAEVEEGPPKRGLWQRFKESLPEFDKELPSLPLGTRSLSIGSDAVVGSQKLEGDAMGSIAMNVGLGRMLTMYDYIRGGLELKLMVAIDFTRSNGGPEHDTSHHRFGGKGANDYVCAMRMVAEVMEQYDEDKRHPIYGFGARLPPSFQDATSDCFACNGDFFSPTVEGLQGLEETYLKALRVIRLHGPSYLREVIKVAALWAKPHKEVHTSFDNGVTMRWWTCLILTDGEILDPLEAADEIVLASNYPVSFVVVGIGDADFSWFQNLDNEVGQLQRLQNRKVPDTYFERKMVHFVRFNDYRYKTPTDMMLDLIGDLPKLVTNYFHWLDIKPWKQEQFEDEVGQALAVPQVDAPPQHLERELAQRAAAAALEEATRSESKISVKPTTDLMQALKQQRELASDPRFVPPFLNDWQQKLLDEAIAYGYSRDQMVRVMNQGVPDGTATVLLDNLLHGGYGKNPTYKQLMQDVDLQLEAHKLEMKALLRNTAEGKKDAPALLDCELEPPTSLAEPGYLSTLDEEQEEQEEETRSNVSASSSGIGTDTGTGSRKGSPSASSRGGSRTTSKDNENERLIERPSSGTHFAGGRHIGRRVMSVLSPEGSHDGSHESSRNTSNDNSGSHTNSKTHGGSRVTSKDLSNAGSSNKGSDSRILPGTVSSPNKGAEGVQDVW